MELVRDVSLVAATVAVGLMAGVFFAYAVSVMPGLGRVNDRTFVSAFQAIDRAIMNPVFLATFAGALLLTGVAALLFLGGSRAAMVWIVVGFVLYLAVVAITMAVNVPRNNEIKEAGDPDVIDVAAVRQRFQEPTWVGWNVVRTVLTAGALICLTVALAVS